MAALIALITLSSQRQVSELQARLNSIGSESAGIMDRFEESLRSLNSTLLRYGTEPNPDVWAEGLNTSRELGAWIDQENAILKAPAEADLLRQIQAAYKNYLQAISDFHARIGSLHRQNASLADFTPVRDRSQRLFDLGKTLARTHYRTHDELLRHANSSLERLHLSVLILLALVLGFGIVMAILVYRQLISPLRIKLVDTQAHAEQHKELASLGLLASDVAHEIRNPLQSIKIGMSFQKNNLHPGSSERADAEVIEREIQRLERILDDFLDFTRPPAPEFATLKLETFLHELSCFFTPQLAGIDVQLVTEILMPMQVRADAAQLKKVIINLVQNAMGSIGRCGRITLRARPGRQMLAGSETDVAILELADTGKGIPPEVQKRLFQPLFTTKKDGTGLGLSIIAQIIQRHGGELRYQTRVNHGTTFIIILPQV